MDGIIIGGGIGGLTLAAAMHQLGQPITVYEAAPEIREVGAGILLGTNAMLVLQAMGLEQEVKRAGKILVEGRITDPSYNCLQKMPLDTMQERYGIPSVIIHRGKLQHILLQSIPDHYVKTGHQAISILEGERPLVKFANDATISADYLIAADGIKSLIRGAIFPDHRPRYSGQTCWRGIVNYRLPDAFKRVATEIWGRSGRFGFVEIANHKVYWYAVKKAPEGEKDSLEFLMNELTETFQDFDKPVQDIIHSTQLNHIIRNDLYDLRPTPTWYRNNICFLGDAIHATTPNLGQGGAQAIEDGLALARCINNSTTISEAFETYQSLRFPKANFVIRQSRLFGQIAHLENPLLIWLRK